MSDEQTPFSAWLEAELDRRGLSISEFARQMQVVPETARGIQLPKPPFAARMGNVLGYPADYIIAKSHNIPASLPEGDAERAHAARGIADLQQQLAAQLEAFNATTMNRAPHNIPIVGYVAADSVRWTAEDDLGAIDALERILGSVQSPVALIARGDCMRAIGILPGDTIIVDRRVDRAPRQRERLAGETSLAGNVRSIE